MTYDLIIVGGGPAGAVATLYAARHGLRTLLLDRARFPRDKVCGDAIGGKAVAVLRDLGLEDEVAALPGIRFRKVVFGSARHVEAEVDLDRARKRDFVNGFVIRREVFDNFLFERAREAATDCREGFAVENLIFDDSQVCGVKGRDLATGEEREFRGRIVIGADGYRSIVARKIGIYAVDSVHWIVALRRYYRNVGGLSDRIELHYVKAVTPGYFWIFPLENGLANVGIGMLGSAMKKKGVNLVDALEETIRDPYFAPRFAAAEPVEKPVGWHLPVGSRHRRCHGPGYMLLGDAAGLIDPFTGEGIANAVYSARVAVDVAAAALQAGDASAESLARYDRELWAAIGEELKISSKLQWIARSQLMLNFTIRKAAGSEELKDRLCAMIAQEVSREEMTGPLFYLKLLAK